MGEYRNRGHTSSIPLETSKMYSLIMASGTYLIFLIFYIGWIISAINGAPHSYMVILLLCIIMVILSTVTQQGMLGYSRSSVDIGVFVLVFAGAAITYAGYYEKLPTEFISGEWGFFHVRIGSIEKLPDGTETIFKKTYDYQFEIESYVKLVFMGVMTSIPPEWFVADCIAIEMQKHPFLHRSKHQKGVR